MDYYLIKLVKIFEKNNKILFIKVLFKD